MSDQAESPPNTQADAPKPAAPEGAKGTGPAKVVEIRPIAAKARMRRRHWGVLISFLVCVMLPLLLSAWYLWARAEDQFASTVGFTVRQEGNTGAADVLGLASQLTGGSTQTDMDVLYEFLQNQNIVERIDRDFDLAAHYSQHRSSDPLFSLAPDATLEEKVDFWQRIARLSYNQSSGLMEVEILAFDAGTAHAIATKVLQYCQDLINELNATARADRIKYAQEDLDLAVERLSKSREDLIRFRIQNKIVDLDAELQSRLGVVSTLQGQLAEALVELDLLAISTTETDPRYVQSQNQIRVIRKRIEAEKEAVLSGSNPGGDALASEDYPTLLAEYESLLVNREYAEQTYRAGLAALDIARAEASRQSSYLAPFLKPTRPESSTFPRREMLFALIALFITMGWSILTLVYYSVRDSR